MTYVIIIQATGVLVNALCIKDTNINTLSFFPYKA